MRSLTIGPSCRSRKPLANCSRKWYEVVRIEFDVQARLSEGGDPPLDQLASAALDRCAQSLGLVRDKVAVQASQVA